MLEGSGERVPQPIFLKAIKQGVQHTQRIVNAIGDLASKCGKPKAPQDSPAKISPDLEEILMRYVGVTVAMITLMSRTLSVY